MFIDIVHHLQIEGTVENVSKAVKSTYLVILTLNLTTFSSV